MISTLIVEQRITPLRLALLASQLELSRLTTFIALKQLYLLTQLSLLLSLVVAVVVLPLTQNLAVAEVLAVQSLQQLR
jgi:hypothetical protein